MTDRPKDWWKNPSNSDIWLEQLERNKDKKGYKYQSKIVLEEVQEKGFESILEVGSGNGQNIGLISNVLDTDAHAADINPKLLEFVKTKYPRVKTFEADIIDLPFDNDSIDLVFTFQVLQHIPPDEIRKAIGELRRVAKKEVWCWEGIGRHPGYKNGDKTSNSHNGSWVWNIDKFVDCYEVKLSGSKDFIFNTIKLYKISLV